TVENHPIAALNLVGDELTVSIATNFALISGKKDRTNPAICIEVGTDENGKPIYQDNGYGYEYEESNYNPNYNSFFNSDEGEQYGYKKEVNDNDEFMWSANFVEKLSMAHLTGDSHTYKLVTVEAFCGTDGFTEDRCTDCGAVKANSRVYDRGTAHEHHFIRFDETYYTKDDGGSWNKGTSYVCPMCGYAVSEPTEPGSYADEEEQAEYEEKKAEYEAAAESAGHTYVPVDAVWSEDGTSVSFRKLECSSNCLERKPYLDALLNDDSISVTVAKEDEDPVTAQAELKEHEGDCTVGAVAVYVASGEVNGYAYTATYKVQLRPSEHIFDDNDICKVCGTGRIIRLSGKTRYETSFAIADKLKETLQVETFDTIVVAYGDNFPDALAGSYLAAQKNAPILLTQQKNDSDVLAYIQKNLSQDGTVYILGGSAAVSDAFADGLKDAGIAYERLSGKSRYETNLAILEEAGLNGNEILVCTGESFADALAVSAVNKPILLVNGTETTLTDAQKNYLNALDGEYTFYIIGGTAPVSAELQVALGAYGNVKRISGKGRYETSVAVAETFFTDVERVTLAYAQDYPDGLCGGALACKLGAPVLLVESGKESAAADYVAENGIKRGVVFGGAGRITDESVRTVFDLPADAEIELIRYS
ncbi:MAG: cell wall-binding repeat-containing protein, partial [Candidatus Faecousia sp.]|nr:cell wall-binding repeat-containing protein [Candidatus Faecousia sp.]